MVIVERVSEKAYNVEIIPVVADDYKSITKSHFWFNWKEEKNYQVFKLQIDGTDEILGLLSLESFKEESRIEIRLLAVSKENRGKNKKYHHIVGNLIAFSCIQSLKLYGEWACVSLVPKTKLVDHYINKYSMLQAGKSLFLDGDQLIDIIKKYDHD